MRQSVPSRLAEPPREGGLPVNHPCHYRQLTLPVGDLWLYAYGSLMWHPPFRHTDAQPALLRGYHRSFCIYSTRYRGTTAAPGLVLGLDHGGACRGRAFRIPRADAMTALETVWQQEMRRCVYVPRFLPVQLSSGRPRPALALLANRNHGGYAGKLPEEEVARTIASCRGERGPNIDYLVNTITQLHEMGVQDAHLHRVLAAVRRIERRHGAGTERPA